MSQPNIEHTIGTFTISTLELNIVLSSLIFDVYAWDNACTNKLLAGA